MAAHRTTFLNDTTADLVVLDMPLLFEIGADAWVTSVLVVSVPADVQKGRVMARGDLLH